MSARMSEADFAVLSGARKPRSKYGAKPVVVTEAGEVYEAKAAKANGITGQRFDSKAEANRWLTLKVMERAGYIRDLARQVSYDLHAAGGDKVSAYRADFFYWDVETGERVVEDCKGAVTALYALKRKWLAAEYGITIREIRA